MTLHVVPIADPAPGTDWLAYVPGRYFYDVTGITATLTTGSPFPSILHDRSGNGLDGIYQPGPPSNPLGPGFFPGANAAAWFRNSNANLSYGQCPPFTIDDGIAFSFDGWLTGDPTAAGAGMFGIGDVSAGQGADFAVAQDGTILFRIDNGITFYQAATAPGAFPYDGNPHHVGMSYDLIAATFYLDGVLVASVSAGVGSAAPGSLQAPTVGIDIGAYPTNTRGSFGQPAFYQSTLAAGVFAAHAAATGSLAAYTAAVLADAPAAYYDLDDVVASTGREPSLVISDGTHDVEVIPPGFPAVATPGPYRYSWTPSLSADVQSSDGTLTTVATGPIRVPGGYLIGPRTLDIQSGDQWSNIVLQWDDGYMMSLPEFNPYLYPPGANLIYQPFGA